MSLCMWEEEGKGSWGATHRDTCFLNWNAHTAAAQNSNPASPPFSLVKFISAQNMSICKVMLQILLPLGYLGQGNRETSQWCHNSHFALLEHNAGFPFLEATTSPPQHLVPDSVPSCLLKEGASLRKQRKPDFCAMTNRRVFLCGKELCLQINPWRMT